MPLDIHSHTHHTTETTAESLEAQHDVALTEAAQRIAFINSKHREVQRLGRTAKEIAAEIGKMLLAVKANLKHGEFGPWVEANCAFTPRMAQMYLKVWAAKNETRFAFDECNSIREVLNIGKEDRQSPPQERRSATLDDLRKVERLRALRDDPSATEGERANAQAKPSTADTCIRNHKGHRNVS